ncbi:ABC transporter substrate-binding protein [Deltaproteobacteria bacterium TL4]
MQDIEIVDLAPGEMLTALSNGTVDAVGTWEPFVYSLKQSLKIPLVSWTIQNKQSFYWLLIGTKTLTQQRSAALQRLLKALVQAEAWLTPQTMEEAKLIISQNSKADLAYIHYMWNKNHFEVTLPQALILAMEDVAQWNLSHQNTSQGDIPNYLQFIYWEGLQAVKPEAISILH